MREPVQRFLWLRPFPPPSPPGVVSPCSTASAVLRANPTSPPFPAQDYGIQPSLARRARVAPARWRSPSFRAIDFPACAGSSPPPPPLPGGVSRFPPSPPPGGVFPPAGGDPPPLPKKTPPALGGFLA